MSCEAMAHSTNTRGGDCRINSWNQVETCYNQVKNETCNTLGKGDCWYIFLLQQSQPILPKIESLKPYPDIMYYTSPGPIFHVDSEYEVRNQILDLCHVLSADLCWMAACMIIHT